MSALLRIKSQKNDFLSRLNSLVNEAAASAEKVAAACANIQRVYRGRVDRAFIAYKAGHATTIQRLFRGHCGRKRSRKAKAGRNERRVFSMFTYFALQLQRSYRGYYSRKYRSNHADRKKFIGDLEETGRKVRAMMYQYAQDQAIREEQAENEKASKDFRDYASNLHHLVSTKQIRGIFNPPEKYMEVPTWRERPVEEHVRNTIRDLLRTRGISKTGLVLDINGTRKIPYVGLKSRLSVQASAHFDTQANDRRRIALIHELLTREKGSWFAGGRTNIINHKVVPLSIGDPYVDANLNPLLKKGVPASQAQLLESARTQKALFNPPLERPFYSRTGGNRSSVHPNGIFDVINDAETSGGVTLRALGTSARFGVPDSCDNRPAGGNIPEPPIRASTIRVTRRRVNSLKVRAKPQDKTALLNQVHQVGLTGVAPYEKAGNVSGNNNGDNGRNYGDADDFGLGPEEDGEQSPGGSAARGFSPTPTPAQSADPYASSDDDY